MSSVHAFSPSNIVQPSFNSGLKYDATKHRTHSIDFRPVQFRHAAWRRYSGGQRKNKYRLHAVYSLSCWHNKTNELLKYLDVSSYLTPAVCICLPVSRPPCSAVCMLDTMPRIARRFVQLDATSRSSSTNWVQLRHDLYTTEYTVHSVDL